MMSPGVAQRPLQLRLQIHDRLLVDNFAGGGGASYAIEQVFGRPVDIAVNHDREAIAMHEVNHPHTRHYCQDVFSIDPRRATGGKSVALAWFSPDCKHFSKAKGGRPRSRKIRDLAWVVIRWAATVRPQVIMLENVEEFRDWGPLLADGNPCPKRKGATFARWRGRLESLGYEVDCRELRACDYGAPTIRKRLFLVARCDGRPIAWPDPTHGDPASGAVKSGKLRPWRTAAECIDWSIPCPSIFERKRPLAENTLKRIARGIQRYVIEAAEPFIVTYIWTQTTENHGLVSAFLAKHYGGNYEGAGSAMSEPAGTVTTRDHNAVVASHLVKFRGTCKDGQVMDAPIPTVMAGGTHVGEVRAFLCKYYGSGGQHQDCREPMHTVPTRDRFGLVTVAGEEYRIVDIGMRMLEPRELFRAQGFPESYIIAPQLGGKPLSKAAQVRMCGNSVSPAPAMALLRANVGEMIGEAAA